MLALDPGPQLQFVLSITAFMVFGIASRVYVFTSATITATTIPTLLLHYGAFILILFAVKVSSVRFVKFQAIQTLMDLLAAKDQFTRYIR